MGKRKMTWLEAAGLALLGWVLFVLFVDAYLIPQWPQEELAFPTWVYRAILITLSPLAVLAILWFRALYLAFEVNDPSGDEKH